MGSVFSNHDGTTKSFYHFGGGGAIGLSASSTVLSAVASNGSTLVPVSASDLRSNGFSLNFGSTQPSSNQFVWGETASGYLKNGMPWAWNGNYWVSPLREIYRSFVAISAADFSFFPLDDSLNYYVSRLVATTLTGNNQDASNHWQFRVVTYDQGNTTASNVGSGTLLVTTGDPSNQFRFHSVSLNGYVSQSSGARVFQLLAEPIGSPGVLYGALQMYYQLAR